MADPVNLADVLADHCGHPQWCVWFEGDCRGGHLRDAVLAYGGGDPVVVMPDGTLKRLSRYYPDNLLTDPVAPDA